jgi:hypothetical protein
MLPPPLHSQPPVARSGEDMKRMQHMFRNFFVTFPCSSSPFPNDMLPIHTTKARRLSKLRQLHWPVLPLCCSHFLGCLPRWSTPERLERPSPAHREPQRNGQGQIRMCSYCKARCAATCHPQHGLYILTIAYPSPFNDITSSSYASLDRFLPVLLGVLALLLRCFPFMLSSSAAGVFQ